MISNKRQALFWAALFLFLVAFILHIEQLFWMAAAVALILPVSLILARRKLHGLSVSRRAPQTLTAGEEGQVVLTVHNDASARRLFVQAVDGLPDRAEGNEAGGIIPVLPAGESERVTYTLQTTLRGVYGPGPLRLRTTDTLGIADYAREFDEQSEIVVYPAPLTLPGLWPRGGGARRARTPLRTVKGEGLDYYGIREYAPGDDIRRVDWKTTARTGDLMVREFHREVSLYAVGIVDLYQGTHRGEGEWSTLEQGIILAATAMKQAVDTGAPTCLIAEGIDDYSVTDTAYGSQLNRYLEALARAETTPEDNWPGAVVSHLSVVPRGATVCVFSPRTDETTLHLAQRLRARSLTVGWFLLEAAGGSEHHRAVSKTITQLTNAGCSVRVVDCSRPLPSQFSARQESHAAGI